MRYSFPLLISPTYSSSYYDSLPSFPPIGLGYVAEYLNKNGVKNDFVDMAFCKDKGELFKTIKNNGNDIIGISLMTYKYKENYDFILELKKELPDIPICVGGPHVSSFKELVLKECPAIDFAITLEGEESFFELCGGKSFSEIKGLIYRDNSFITYTGDRPLKQNIDDFPFPTYQNFILEHYQVVGISTSRGCHYQCVFCESSALLGKIYRARSPGQVVEEFAYWYKKGKRNFSLLEDNFTVIKKRVLDICQGIKSLELKGVSIEGNNIRADNLTYDVLKNMRAIGVNSMCIGVESGSDKILKVIKKGETISQIDEAVKMAIAIGYRVKLYFMVGHPEETWKDFMQSIKFSLKYPVESAKFYSVMPVPGTELYEMVKANGEFLENPESYISERNPFYQKPFFVYKTGMSLREKTRALRLAEFTIHKIEFRYRFRHLGAALSLFIAQIFFLPGLYRLWSAHGIFRRFFKAVNRISQA